MLQKNKKMFSVTLKTSQTVLSTCEYISLAQIAVQISVLF